MRLRSPFSLFVPSWSWPILAALLALSGSARAEIDPEAGLPFLQVFTPRDYRGHQQVMRIAEDAAGLLYFGNLNKVLVYDGARWSTIPVPDATFIRGLAVDAHDTLWIGGVDDLGYAKSDGRGSRTFVSLRDQLPPAARDFGEIWHLVVTPTGPIFQSNTWLLRWDGRRFATLALPDSDRWRLAQVGPEVWASDSTQGWFRIRDNGPSLLLEPLPAPSACRGDRALAAVPQPGTQSFLIATDTHGFWLWDGTTFTKAPTALDGQLVNARPYAMTSLRDGRLVVTSLQSGLWITDPAGQPLTHLLEPQGLTTKTAICAYTSHDGETLWVGLDTGIARIDVRPWLTWFNPLNGAPTGQIYPVVRYRGEVRAAASGAGMIRLIPATATAPARLTVDRASTTHLNGISVVGEDLILADEQGFITLTPDGTTSPVPNSPHFATDFFPLRQPPGVWAALNNNEVRLFRRNDAGAWHTDGPIPGIERVRGLVEDSDGAWWLGRPAGGVLRATFPHGFDQPPTIETFTAPDGLPSGHGWTRITADARGPLLTCNLGLFRFDAAAHRWLPTADYGRQLADGSTYVNATSFDETGGLWAILRPAGVAESGNQLRLAYARDGHLTTLQIPRLTLIEDPSHLAYEPARDGRPATLWIAGQGALVRLDVDQWRRAAPAPPPHLYLRSIVTGQGTTLPLSGGSRLPYDDRSLKISFSAPQLATNPGAEYESVLISSSGAETSLTNEAHRDFSSLGSGRYFLKVRAHAVGGEWSAPTTVSFRVLPPAWLHPLALGAYIALAAVALVAAWTWRNHRWHRRQLQLEAIVARRTAELAAQNIELQRLRQIELDEKLEARLAEHKARLEVLRYQLNPHFLFNTLTSICAQIIQSPRTARDTVIRLAEFCRLTLHRPDEDVEPTLGEEVKMLRAYLDIEQTRLGELLQYSIVCDPALHTLKLPPFLLLPLVENAVKYGAATSHDLVQVRLDFRREPSGQVLVEVANTGHWVESEADLPNVASLSIGIENLRQRLTRYFPDRHQFTADFTAGWVVVRLRLTF